MGSPKILLLDIETAPAIAYVWHLFDENISIDQLIQPSRVICWGAKWLGERKLMYADERGGARQMFEAIHALLSEADAVATYNGDHFDLPKLDGSFIEHGLPPPPPVTSIDLIKTVKKLGYQSNKLAFVGPHLKIGAKVKHEGFPLWRACMDGDADAWKRMRKYNLGDVLLLESLYNILRPYIRRHPYMGAVGKRHECPACQSMRSQHRGYRRTKAFVIQRIQCLDCGGWFEGERKAA